MEVKKVKDWLKERSGKIQFEPLPFRLPRGYKGKGTQGVERLRDRKTFYEGQSVDYKNYMYSIKWFCEDRKNICIMGPFDSSGTFVEINDIVEIP